MGIYWAAVDNLEKKYFEAPEGFSIKTPGIYYPGNPFPGMVVMMNSRGYRFEIENDMSCGCYYDRDYEDITKKVYADYLKQIGEESKVFTQKDKD